jgi:hypothetical protein
MLRGLPLRPVRAQSVIVVIASGIARRLCLTAFQASPHSNEMLLDAIRLDFARPTIHARNLFHVSAI